MPDKPQSNLSQLRDFLAYLATVKGDLSNVTAPPFVLSPKSVTEMPAAWAERHDLFVQPASEGDPARRALLVLKNFLCSQKRQVYTAATAESDGGAKKPLNAFLGELFLATVGGEEEEEEEEEEEGRRGETASVDGNGQKQGDGRERRTGEAAPSSATRLICEQVSHHPPVTACYLYNRAHGISSSGYVAQETTFSPAGGGVRVRQIGHAIIRDERHAESHLMTLPTMAIRGLVTGSPYPELCGTCYVASSSGYLSTITFEGGGRKGPLGLLTGGGSSSSSGAARNSVRAVVARARDGEPVFEVEGHWNGELTVREAGSGAVIERFRVDDVPRAEVRVAPAADQSPWESRRAWRGVTEGIRAGDMRAVAEAKGELENAQRELRAAEGEAGVRWPTLFFLNGSSSGGGEGSGTDYSTRSQEFELLAQIVPDSTLASLQPERTAGVWRFIGEGAAESILADGIFHRGLEPTGQVVGAGG